MSSDTRSPPDTASRSRLSTLLAEALRTVGEVITGPITESDGTVTALDGQFSVTGECRDEPGQGASLAHTHITTIIGRTTFVPLEACVMGVNADRDAALREAANNWLHMVAAPILSLMTNRYVFDADHFGANDTWGVPGLHGFVGPAFVRGNVDGFDMEKLGTASFFRDAAPLVTDDRPHLLKSTISFLHGRWSRTLEIDGHGDGRTDPDFAWGMPPPAAPVFCVRYAVAFRGR